MKIKFILLIFITLLASQSFAKWEYTLSSKDDFEDKYYIEEDTIRKSQGYTYAWTLNNYSKPNKYGDLSAKVLRKIDCEIMRYKRPASFYYTKRWGEGSFTSGDGDAEWLYSPPSSISYNLMEAACNIN